MKTKLITILEDVKTSFWFIPTMIVSTAIALSFLLIHLDSEYQIEMVWLFGFFVTQDAESARTILSTIAGAMLNVTSIVFSITLVALTMASSQFGSRLLRNFMNDRLNQTVLGTYIATFMFCLLILRVVNEGNGREEFIPNISIFVSLVIALANIFLLIAYIHHIAIIIQADHIIADVDEKLHRSIQKIFPFQIGQENMEQSHELMDDFIRKIPYKDFIYVKGSGYLQFINGNRLLEFASKKELILVVHFQPGDLVVNGSELVQVHSYRVLEEDDRDFIRNSFVLNEERTPTQDVRFSVNQLVEVISRALSSGINDPFTAITAMDKLISNLCELADAKFPSPYRFDEENQLRLVCNPVTFSSLMSSAFNQVRQYGKTDAAILIRLMEGLAIIKGFTKIEERKSVILKHARMTMRTGERGLEEEEDLKDLRERYNKVLAKT